MTPSSPPAYDAALSPLRSRLGDLAAALARWETRDDARPQPGVRRAANDAIDAIDAMLAGLHGIRSRLTGEIRASDDATAARVDAMLAERAAR
jgi:hypothetical protein